METKVGWLAGWCVRNEGGFSALGRGLVVLRAKHRNREPYLFVFLERALALRCVRPNCAPCFGKANRQYTTPRSRPSSWWCVVLPVWGGGYPCGFVGGPKSPKPRHRSCSWRVAPQQDMLTMRRVSLLPLLRPSRAAALCLHRSPVRVSECAR